MDDQRNTDPLDEATEANERAGKEAEHELKQHGDQLQEQIDNVRDDWERKKDDSAVPGATGVPDGPG